MFSLRSSFLVLPALLARASSEDADRRLIYSYDNSDSQTPWGRFAGGFPYLVSIRYNGNHQCGGTLIRANWVLTAAHCFYSSPTQVSKFQVRYLASTTANDFTLANVDLIVVHPTYHMVTLDDDIALIRLSTAAPSTKPLAQLEQTYTVHGGKQALIAGWGSLDAAGTQYADVLKEGPTQIVARTRCEADNQKFNGTEFICNDLINQSGIASPKDISGAGSGDSGGPLFVNDTTDGLIQVGLVSHTVAQGRDIFVRVSTYYDWITGIVNSPPTTSMFVPPLCQGSCCDDGTYEDPYGAECGSYASKDCSASATGFTAAETDALLNACLSSCNGCAVCEATNTSCCDKVDFTTTSGKLCEQFQGVDCTSDAEAAELRDNCPSTCGFCTTGTDCTDVAYFEDAKRFTCPQWKGYDCSRASEDYGYSQANEDLLLQFCPLSCGTCTSAQATSTTMGDGISASISACGTTSLMMALLAIPAVL